MTGHSRAGSSSTADRRSTGLLRVPFIRRCTLVWADGAESGAFIINVNVLGAYVSGDEMPPLGKAVQCRFKIPGNDREMVLGGIVAWLNPKQQHPVHSLPPGFGVKFQQISEDERRRIEGIVQAYVTRHPSVR